MWRRCSSVFVLRHGVEAHRIRKRSSHMTLRIVNRGDIVAKKVAEKVEVAKGQEKQPSLPEKKEATENKGVTEAVKPTPAKRIAMGQKVNPISMRLGIVRRWNSMWFEPNKHSTKAVEDYKIRNYIRARIPQGAIARIDIERMLKYISFTIYTARAGVVIGRGGTEVDKIREELRKITQAEVQIKIQEVKRPELEASLVGGEYSAAVEGTDCISQGYEAGDGIDDAYGCTGDKDSYIGSSWGRRDGTQRGV